MSYILEALKRSEQERISGAAPSLYAVQVMPFQKERKGFRLYALAACMMAATALIGWRHPWQIEKGEVDEPRSASVVPLPASRSVPQTAIDAAPDRRRLATIQESAESVNQTVKPNIEQPAARTHSPISKKRAKTPPVMPAAPTGVEAKTSARTGSRQDFTDFTELPTAIQQALNKVAITGYVGSPDDPSGQMVVIDNRLLREGDEISQDLKLEQIAAGKAILGYKGYHFHLPLP